MVRQIILVVLALAGFVKVESRQCYRCSGDSTKCNIKDAAKQIDCPAEQNRCLSMAMNDESGMHFVYGCANTVDCKAAMYACAEIRKNNPQTRCNAACCDDDWCAEPIPKEYAPLQCYECSSEKGCEMAKLSPCSGNETQCFKITTKVEHKDTNVELKSYSKGCTTKALCEKPSSNFFSCSDKEDCQIDCCDSNYCNAGTNSVLSAFTFLACTVFTFARL